MPSPCAFKLTAKKDYVRMVGIFTVYDVLGHGELCLWRTSWEAL